MAGWNDSACTRGLATYRNACYNCHGDTEQPGSIHNSRRFWQEAFRNGADPYALYQTLTRGFGLMPPQVRLTPREKYDVIHFIREEFLKKHNPDTEVLSTPIIRGRDRDAYAVDVLTLPQDTPWKSRMRPTGIDFLPGGDEAVVTTIDGAVWRVEGLAQSQGTIHALEGDTPARGSTAGPSSRSSGRGR